MITCIKYYNIVKHTMRLQHDENNIYIILCDHDIDIYALTDHLRKRI